MKNFQYIKKVKLLPLQCMFTIKKNDIDFNDIINKCKDDNNIKEGKSILSETLDNFINTKKIIIKSNQNDLGTINDKNKLKDILNIISSSRQYGDAFLCDGRGFDFEIYDNKNKLIDTIYVWGDGKRLIPASIHSGCSYYSVSKDTDLRKIIEDETNYAFYNILNFTDDYNGALHLIYNDNKYNYYLRSESTNEILIQFLLNSQVMTLEYALNNSYIEADKGYNDYPDLLIRKSKLRLYKLEN